jgi:hypothetical protein
MTGEQCREARERMGWTRLQLATATDVPLWFIAAFEDCKATPDFLAGYEVDLRAALESAGVEFIAENGGGVGARLRKGAAMHRASRHPFGLGIRDKKPVMILPTRFPRHHARSQIRQLRSQAGV